MRVELLGAGRSRRRSRRPAGRAARPPLRSPRPPSTPGCAASTSSTSSGWMFSPPETIMSSTRPSSQRSPSSSRCPVSPVAVPAVLDRLRVGVRPVPVAGERLVRAEMHEDLAVLVEAEPRVDGWAAGAPRLRELVAPDRERVDLGRAVVVDEHLRPEHVDAAPDEASTSSRRRHSRARAPKRRRAVADVRVVDEVVEERRREVQRADRAPPRSGGAPRPRPSAAAGRSSRRRGASRASEWIPIVW